MEEKRYLNETEVARITSRAKSTLQKDRFYGRGIPYSKINGRSVRYALDDVLWFMENQKVNTENKAA